MQSEITLTSKQNEYIRNAHARWNFKIGAVRSGKSYVDVTYTIPSRIIERKGLSGLNVILGVSRDTIERNVLQPMREKYTSDLVSTINSKNVAIIRGEPVYCLGAEKISQVAKILGSSIKYAYGDEIAKWNPEVFEVLKSRLDKEYSCFDGACNPESPNHWLKGFTDDEDLDAYIQHYTIWDNPFLPREFVENLCKEYEGTVYYGRYIEGEWTLAEGLVFPRWEEAVTDEIPDTPVQEYCISCDYGTSNPFAVLLWERHENIWYASHELYYSGRDTGTQKTDDEYLTMLNDFVAGIELPRQHTMYGDHIQQIPVIIDPSAASMIALLRKSEKFVPMQADNNVYEYGLSNTTIAITRGLIKIHRRCKNWANEAQSYVWNPNSVVDEVIKAFDHLMDATRYFVNTKKVVKNYNNYKSIFGGR